MNQNYRDKTIFQSWKTKNRDWKPAGSTYQTNLWAKSNIPQDKKRILQDFKQKHTDNFKDGNNTKASSMPPLQHQQQKAVRC